MDTAQIYRRTSSIRLLVGYGVRVYVIPLQRHGKTLNPLMGAGNYSATSNNMKLVHWPLMGRLLHLAQRGGAWAALQPAQASHRCIMVRFAMRF